MNLSPIFLRPPGPARTRPNLSLLVAVTMTGTVAMHVFVPALSSAAADLGTTPFLAQLTITLYLCGLAGGQLVYGPLSDRFGRRPLIIFSLSLYLVGFLLAIPATGIGWLVFARVLQSLGGCGSLVIGRAMVRDISNEDDATRQLAVLTMAMTLTPALAPALGGLINAWFGWRAIFAFLAVVVGILLAIVVLTLPETNRRPVAIPGFAALVSGYRHLLVSAKFRRYTVAGACGGTTIYAFLAVAPFLIIDVLRRPPAEVGLYCLLVTAGMIAGSALARAWAGGMELRRAARIGNLVCLAGAGGLLVVDLMGDLTIVTLIVPLIVYAMGVGILGPNAVAGLMGVYPDRAGAASSLYGFIQMGVGALATLAVGLWHTESALSVATTLLVAALISGAALQRL